MQRNEARAGSAKASRALGVAVLVAIGCTGSIGESAPDGLGGSATISTERGPGGGGSPEGATSAAGGEGPVDEIPPEPADGDGVTDPPGKTLHNKCSGSDWQLLGGWVQGVHKPPVTAPAGEIERCIERYAGWVTNEADDAKVSRASVYAALAATGQCDADAAYDGELLPASVCTAVHADLDDDACLEAMAASKAFGIETVAKAIALEDAAKDHDRDPPRIAAYLATGKVDCGGPTPWKLAAPEGYIDRYVGSYNAYRALSGGLPSCSKRLVMTVALYAGMGSPGVDGVADSNGCWSYDRVSAGNPEWKLCWYDGKVTHANGLKWAYDDTNTNHSSATEVSRINACMKDVPGRGYVYMANRGAGWPKRVTEGVRAHFAELYSSQFTMADQFNEWVSANKPGHPMVHVGESSFSVSSIHDVTLKACKQTKDGEFMGIYVYPVPLEGDRLNAVVEAMNECTK